MDRRKFIAAIGGALACPGKLRAQATVWRIGLLSALSGANSQPYREAFVQGMRELGFVSEKNFLLIERYADGKADRLPGLAAELVQLKVDLIFTSTVQAVSAAQRATASIPIVFVAVSDPVKLGIADSVARPGRNLTGMSNFAGDLAPKRLELLKALLPKLSRVGFLVNPGNPNTPDLIKLMQVASDSLGLQVQPVDVGTPDEVEPAFASMARGRTTAVVLSGDVFHFGQRERIAAAATKHKIASIFPFREYAEAGGLMSYGTDVAYQFRYAAAYVVKILKGAKPGELPIEQPTRFEFLVNLKTAKAIGLAVPQSLLLRADRVIE